MQVRSEWALPPVPGSDERAGRARISVVDDDGEMRSLIAEIFSEAYEVAESSPDSMTSIADQEPDLIIVGLLDQSRRELLSGWEIVALARRHRRLSHVPIVMLSTDMTLMTDRDRLATYSGLHVAAVPFELDDVRAIVGSVARQVRSRPRSAAAPGR